MDKLDNSRVDNLFYNVLVSCIEMYTQFISFVVAHIYASLFLNIYGKTTKSWRDKGQGRDKTR